MAKGGDRGKGQVCGVENCRSRTFEEGEDGFLYCQNGHRKGDLVIGSDEDDFEGAAKRARTTKKKEADDKEKVSKNFKGAKATELYLKSLQLILRHQVWFLVHDKGLPSELETVVQDLWTVRILQFEEKITDKKQEFDSSQALLASDIDNEDDKEPSVFHSHDKKLQETPTLIDCLVLCYLGIITLRLPVTPGDIYDWTTEGKMAYRRAIKLVPVTMRDRLPNGFLGSLDPNSLLAMHRFYQSLFNIQRRFAIEHGVLWPPLNVPVLLFRYLKELSLPLELYDATIRLGNLLEYDFATHAEDTKRLGVRHLPEAQLIACLGVCVKLCFPFDGKPRYPRSNAEPAATSIDWRAWCNTMRNAENNRKDEGHFTMEELTKLEERDVFDMTGDHLDQYLDFYLENFVDETDTPNDFRKGLYDLFPIDKSQPVLPEPSHQYGIGQEKWEALRKVHGNIKSRSAIAQSNEEAEVRRPGHGYVAYKRENFLPEHANVFYEEAGKIAGLTLEMMVSAVFAVENRVERWKRGQRALQKS
ncbi:hypothetical protein CC80DRAFT_479584 [Byssothecium circinans]|uniref:Uncharacterized protein n=1 Tax=Byssothecium circinans TaxID=147558 RepID=A0A6A5TNG5_9PLEO|nr:hypothetical protein CC80DRAFT_479584 [Byssothecium circinans]